MKRNIMVIVVTTLLLSAGLLVWHFFFRNQRQVLFHMEKPSYGYIAEYVTATGTIQPLDTVSVGAQVSGTISMLNADFNSVVKKGQLLAQLDKTLLKAAVDQDQADLEMQRSQLEFDRNNFERHKRLWAADAVGRLAYESALKAYHVSLSAVANAEAQLKASTKNLSFADIYAPIDGVILSRNVSIGQTVASTFSTPTLFIIAKDIKRMQVQASVDEADIGYIHQGQRVSFTVDAFIDDAFNGTVADVRLHPRVSANVVSYTTIIDASNQAMKLKPGMTANITVYTKEVRHALKIPLKALGFSPDDSLKNNYRLLPAKQPLLSLKEDKAQKPAYVWIKKGDVLEQRAVETGIDDGTVVQIISGLKEDDLVVVSMQPD